jgi:hypothetical protein
MNKQEAVWARVRRSQSTAIAGLAIAVSLAFLASPAFAQDQDIRGQTVNERPRPTYDAKGIPVGGFVLYPLLDVNETYDDNIFAADTGEVDDFETTIGPRLSLQSRWSRHSLTLNSHALIHYYAERNEQNTREYGADARLQLDLARDATLVGAGGYERRTVSRTNPEEARRATPEQVDVTSGSASFTQPFVNLRLTISGDVTNYDEVDDRDREKNRVEYTGRVRLGYDVSPAITTFVQPFYTLRDYDQNSDPTGLNLNRDSKVYGGVFGLAYDITDILYGETSVGYYNTKFDDPRFKSDSGLSIDSKTTWNVTSLTSIIARVARENITTNEIIAGLASSSRREVRFGLEVQHELTSNVILNADAGYRRDKFLETTREDKTMEAGASARLLLDNHFSLFASYRYSKRDSNRTVEEYTDNRFLIGVRGQV